MSIDVGNQSRTMIFGVLTLLTSCITPPKEILESELGYKFVVIGAHISTPQETGWYIYEYTLGTVTVGRMGKDSTQSVLGQAQVIQQPALSSDEEICNSIKQQLTDPPNDPRYTDISKVEHCSREDGNLTYRFYLKYRDLGAVNLPDGSDALMVEGLGVIFQHPNKSDLFIFVNFSQRTREDDPYPNFQALAEQFVSGVTFNTDYLDQI